MGTKEPPQWFDTNQNHVYVNGLPTSITEDDFIELMQRCGVIAKKASLGTPYNIKLYKNEDGSFKGDARCCYVKPESIDLALNLLDGYQYDAQHVIHCERAKFELKGSYDPSRKPRALDKKLKIKQKKKTEKLLSWEPELKPKRQKKVILKHMFTPEQIIEDATLIVDLKEDVEAKCAEISCEPKGVDVCDKHPEGVIVVSFNDPDHAESCVKALDNQFYAGQIVKAMLWDGRTKYKIKETDEESQQRLDNWHQYIKGSDDVEKATEEPNLDEQTVPKTS